MPVSPNAICYRNASHTPHPPVDETRVAVASNFADIIREIAERFEQQSGHKVTLLFGSTGMHYAQIYCPCFGTSL